MIIEEWRKIDGWPYSVSNQGRARNDRTGRVLSYDIIKGGYRRVTFCADGVLDRFMLHVLVCSAFNGGPPDDERIFVRHRDGNVDNCFSDNLLWGTRSENEQDKRNHGTYQAGERNPFSKLTETQVRDIRKLFQENLDARLDAGFKRISNGFLASLAVQFQVSVPTIKSVVYGVNWSYDNV